MSFQIKHGVLIKYIEEPDETRVVIPAGVTSIGGSAFEFCGSLEKIVFPDGLTSIGNNAFGYCGSLTEIVIPAGVTSIGDNAFGYCGSLEKIVLPDSIKRIGYEAFKACFDLTCAVIRVRTGSLCIGEDAFDSDCTLEIHADTLEAYMRCDIRCDHILFLNGEAVTDLVIPNGITNIPAHAFSCCVSLKSIVIPDTVKNTDSSAFDGCENLRRVVFHIHAEPLNINGVLTFEPDCTAEVHADTLEAYMNSDITFDHILYLNDEAVTDLVISDGITSIPDGAFRQCVGLTSALIPAGVTRIGEYAFYNCRSLAEVVIPDSVTRIAQFAFCCCTGITELIIPYGVTSIEFGAFFRCSGLKSLSVPDSIRYFDSSLKDCEDAFVHISFPRLCELSVSGDLWEHYAIEIPDEGTALEAYCAAFDRISPESRKYNIEYIRNVEKKLLLSPRCAAAKHFESWGRFEEYVKAHENDKVSLYDALMNDSCSDAVKTKVCTTFLFRAFLRKDCRPAREWLSTYPVNPAMTAAARLLVWLQGDTAFTLDEAGVPVDVCGHPVQLTEGDIFLAHPMEMQRSTVVAWREYFAARHLTQPFAQMEEPVIDPGEIRPDRYADCPIVRSRLENQEKHGITYGHGTCQTADCEADQEECPVLVEADSDEDGYEVVSGIEFRNFRFAAYTRRVNHIVAFLDRCTVRDRILKDDIPARWCLDELSLPKILELIDLAARNRCVNAAAALQQYKLERFGDGAPGDVLDPLP